jgi:tRNA (guanine-N7-)-methyltransferase
MKTMERPARPLINKTSTLPRPNEYTQALDQELRAVAFSEERAPANKGRWREVLGWPAGRPLDLEVGTGNGLFFAHYASTYPDRCLVGLELKYKPLVQSIRRAQRSGCQNAAIARFHAFNVDQLFDPSEINDIFIHFPDPWTSPKKPKNRLTNAWFLNLLWSLQSPGSCLNFKTDSREMFDWSLEEIAQTPYKIEFQTFDLHQSDWKDHNFITGFEKIFIAQGIRINMVRLIK